MEGLKSTRRQTQHGIFDHLGVIGDPLRCRILLLLEMQELTVTELCSVLQLPQSTVSRHLKILLDHDWIRSRRDGTRRRYSATQTVGRGPLHQLWGLLHEEVRSNSAAAQDRSRLEAVLAQRRTRSQEFFSSAAGQWAQMRRELFGRRFDLEGLLGLLDDSWIVADLGCGIGQTTETLARFVERVIAVDESEAMLAAARDRLQGLDNVELRLGQLESLPIQDTSVDAAVVMLVLHHLSEPPGAIAEAARVLRPGGKLLMVDMLAHDHDEYRQTMGHVWLGFEEHQIRSWLEHAGFHHIRIDRLKAEPDAKGPTLFAATAKVAGDLRAT